MHQRRKWMFSNAPIPDRTQRRLRRTVRLRASAWAHARLNRCGETFGGDTSTSLSISEDGHEMGAGLVEAATVTDKASGHSSSDCNEECSIADASCLNPPTSSTFHTSGGINDEEEVQPSAEETETPPEGTLPEPDDEYFWKGKAGHDVYLNTPLTPFLDTTRGDVLVMCLAFGLRYSLPWGAIADLLQMINCVFGQEVVKGTKYFFRKYMEAGKNRITYQWYCHYCHRFLGSNQDLSQDIGPCRCGKTNNEIKSAKSFFITLSMEEQLRDLLGNEEFVHALQYRFQRKKRKEEALEDIFDGELYKGLSKPGQILSHWYNMSFTFNTDGFPVGGKSGKQSCWPIYVQINEVPHHLRSKFMLLAGIYVGQTDPNMQLYMFPFVEQANDLATEGLSWKFNNKIIRSRLIPLCACVDTPARSKILNMTLFSGSYGCTICPNNPESTTSGVRYTLPMNAMDERTHRQILIDAACAHANRITIRNRKKWRVRGLKGPTPLHNLKYFDLVKGVRPDIMHSIFLGNGRHHFQVLSDATYKSYYIGSDVRLMAITRSLLAIKPTSSLARTPRDAHMHSSWKAYEWLEWLLFYAVPCLLNVIPHEYVAHISLLSTSLHIMMQKSISPSDLELAHVLALRYVFLFQQYFGKKEMVINIHLLMHMRRSILYLGPAWTHMAFGFEGANKMLHQLKKGYSSIAQELANKYVTFKALPFLCDRYASTQKTVEFCEGLSGRRLLQSFSRIRNAVLVGKGKLITLSHDEVACLSTLVSVRQKEALSYDKVILNGIRYTVSSYAGPHKTDDSYISVSMRKKARIQKILKCIGVGEDSIFLLVKEVIVSNVPIFDDEFGKHCPLQRITGEGPLSVISPEDISAQCVAMFVDSGNFICEVPYGCYGDS